MAVCAWALTTTALRPVQVLQRRTKHLRLLCSGYVGQPKAARVVFLGTPTVAARTLKRLAVAAAKSKTSADEFELIAVVTQPPAPAGRKRILAPSPVHSAADELGISTVLTPTSARNKEFLSTLSLLEPDLCITAAYGNFLPQTFLDLPRLGTLNIHPSLLPQFRGAAPVPRALEAGVAETGVSIAFTELRMDSGPIVAQNRVILDGSEQTPELLESLFDIGTETLISMLPSVFSGNAARIATAQDEDLASHAPKLSKDDARLTFVENALIVHNKVRAFAGWPGTWADFEIGKEDTANEVVKLKILQTHVIRAQSGMCLGVHDVHLSEDGQSLIIVCDDGSSIAVTEVQPPGKNTMSARSFWNGLRGAPLTRKRVPH